MRPVFLLTSALLLLAPPIVSQTKEKPDLTGTWELNLQRSKLPKTADIHPETLVVKSSDNALEIRYRFNGHEQIETYTVDGKERRTPVQGGGELVAKASWKGTVLIIERGARLRTPLGGDIIWNKDRWKISPDGQSLVIEHDSPRNFSFYEKRAP